MTTAVLATVTTDELRGPLGELDPAALSRAGLAAEDVRVAESARVDLRSGALSVTRARNSNHLTASCLLLSSSDSRWFVALALHARSGQWRQFGGHVEASDRSLRDAAARELLEESGIDARTTGTWLSPSPIAVRIFPVGTTTCASHLDVLFASITDNTRPLATADDGIANVAWWPADDLPTGVADDLRHDLPLHVERVSERGMRSR